MGTRSLTTFRIDGIGFIVAKAPYNRSFGAARPY
jgi:hypothetical protein